MMILRTEPNATGRGREFTVNKTPQGAEVLMRIYDVCDYTGPWQLCGKYQNTTKAISALMDFINSQTDIYILL